MFDALILLEDFDAQAKTIKQQNTQSLFEQENTVSNEIH